MSNVKVESFFHADTFTWTHLLSVGDEAALIDPVLDYDARSANTATVFAERLLTEVSSRGLRLRYLLETHAHADHISAAAWLKNQTGATLAVGAGIRSVQAHFSKLFDLQNLDDPFDQLLQTGDCLPLGNQLIEVLPAAGHTPDSVAYRIGDSVFIGDTLFAPDVGSARCDFPGGDAQALFATAQRLLALPPETRLYLGHDYPPKPASGSEAAREPRAWVSVAEMRRDNLHLRDGISEATFVQMRQTRDAGLAAPALIWPALYCNIRGGALPEPEKNGVAYLKIPLNVFGRS